MQHHEIQEQIANGERLRDAITSVIADCENGALSGKLGIGAMFTVEGPSCVLGHVVRRAGSIPFFVYDKDRKVNYDAVSYLSLSQTNDRAPNSERHTAVLPPLRDWLEAVDTVLGLYKADLVKSKLSSAAHATHA